MTRIVVPALFVIEADTLQEAEEKAFAMQCAANDSVSETRDICYLDEFLPTTRVDFPDNAGLPRTLIGVIPRLELHRE